MTDSYPGKQKYMKEKAFSRVENQENKQNILIIFLIFTEVN